MKCVIVPRVIVRQAIARLEQFAEADERGGFDGDAKKTRALEDKLKACLRQKSIEAK